MGDAPQPSPLAGLNNATPNNGNAVGQPVAQCPAKQWKLNVKVEIAPGFQYAPTLTTVGVALDGIQGTTVSDADDALFAGAASQPIVQFTGCTVVNFKVSGTPTSDEWMAVQDANVALAPGDNKNVVLRVRSRPWIRINVTDADAKTAVDGVAIDLEVPGNKKVNQSTAGGQGVYVNKLDPGTAKLEKMSHAQEVWEMVRIESA